MLHRLAGCYPYAGQLQLFSGSGRTRVPYFTAQQTPLLAQEVAGGLCKCDDADCLAWQVFVLDNAIAVEADREYTVHLSAPRSMTARVGMLVADAYTRGSNNFAVSDSVGTRDLMNSKPLS